jgi:uncharacterized protein (DUF58 family)
MKTNVGDFGRETDGRALPADSFFRRQTRLIPTPRLVFLFALGMLPLTLVAQVPAVGWGVAAFDAGLLLLALVDFRRAPGGAAVTFERRVGPRLAIGEREPVTILCRSDARRGLVVELRDEPPLGFPSEGRLQTLSVPAGSRAQGTYWITPPARGDYAFGGMTARVPGPLGLVRRQWRILHPTAVQVYPNFRLAARLELLGRRSHLLRTGLHSLRRRGQGRTFESLRDYVQGDDTRHMDWKATARRGKPMVREYEVERHQNVLLMLDAGRMMTALVGEMTKLDCAVNASLLVAHAAVTHGDNVGLLVFAEEVLLYLPPRTGRMQVRHVLEALYRIQPRLVEPDYAAAFRYLATRRLQRSLVFVFTDLVDPRASTRLLRHVAALMPRHLALMVAIADPPLQRYAQETPAGVGAVYRNAVARDLLEERAQALESIAARGGLALDVPAEGLHLAAVNRYLEVKRRGLL